MIDLLDDVCTQCYKMICEDKLKININSFQVQRVLFSQSYFYMLSIKIYEASGTSFYFVLGMTQSRLETMTSTRIRYHRISDIKS